MNRKSVLTKKLLILFRGLIAIFVFPAVLTLCIFLKKQRKELVWGPVPIINNKYWSSMMNNAGWSSKTLMKYFYSSINKRQDYDLYFEDLISKWIWPSRLRLEVSSYFALLYIIRNASVVHLPFSGGPLGETPLWRLEAYLFRLAGIRTVLMPYGADMYVYSQIIDPSLRNGLLLSYPDAARNEKRIVRRIQYWSYHADIILNGFMVDALGRWDALAFNYGCINTDLCDYKTKYSACDGKAGIVKVMHAPNHRGVKGTEFLIHAVEELKKEGLKIDLVLLEKVPNDKVLELMQEMDILADQFICTGYGLAAIEGMASGLPVMCNLEHEAYTRVFRRYSYLNECPIVSTSPETIKHNLKVLITNPGLRGQLGQAGRQYVEKYHSYETGQYLFGSIYDKILCGKDVDLMNMFHPLKSEYNKRKPLVKHPLVENRLTQN